jgi:biopolymer transport protein ExbD
VATVLGEVFRENGPTYPIELQIQRGTPTQAVIDLLDILEQYGFENVRSRIRETPLSN